MFWIQDVKTSVKIGIRIHADISGSPSSDAFGVNVVLDMHLSSSSRQQSWRMSYKTQYFINYLNSFHMDHSFIIG